MPVGFTAYNVCGEQQTYGRYEGELSNKQESDTL